MEGNRQVLAYGRLEEVGSLQDRVDVEVRLLHLTVESEAGDDMLDRLSKPAWSTWRCKDGFDEGLDVTGHVLSTLNSIVRQNHSS